MPLALIAALWNDCANAVPLQPLAYARHTISRSTARGVCYDWVRQQGSRGRMATALLQARRVTSGHTSTAAISTEGFDDDNGHHELARCGH